MCLVSPLGWPWSHYKLNKPWCSTAKLCCPFRVCFCRRQMDNSCFFACREWSRQLVFTTLLQPNRRKQENSHSISMESLSKMINNKKPKKFTEDNFNANHVDSLGVIREVKKHRVIYDTEHPRYHDQQYRSEVWDQINVSLYPNYWQYNAALQLQIGVLVRRRWKSVRNYIAQEAKLMVTTEYSRKRESTQWSELQFILPYIKSPYCEKVAADMGIKRLDAEDSKAQQTYDDFNDHSNADNDVNERFVVHEHIKQEDPFEQSDEDDPDYINDDVDDTLRFVLSKPPTQQKPPTPPKPLAHPVDLHYNSNQCSTPPTLTPKPSTQDHHQLPKDDNAESLRKRSRTDCTEDKGTSTDMQQKLIDLLINIEHRQLVAQADTDLQDFDRMFFLSLVSDFKQIPAHKKICVKAKIATIIAEAMS